MNMPVGMEFFGGWRDEPHRGSNDPSYDKLCEALDNLPTSLFAGNDLERRLTWAGRIKLRRLGEYKAYNDETIVVYVGSNRKLYKYNSLTRGFGRFLKLWPLLMEPSEHEQVTDLLNRAM
jgi:hypothetical protein